MPGYTWRGWDVIFGVAGLVFIGLGVSEPASWGLTPVQYKWLMLVLGIISSIGAKNGKSWVKKGNGDSGGPGVLTPVFPFLIVAGTLSLLACTPPPPNLDPQTQKMYTADQAVVRINRLMDAAIEAEAQKALPTSTTRYIVRFCVEADKTIAQYPAGWGPTVAKAWAILKEEPEVKPLLLSNQYVSTAATMVDLMLMLFKQPSPQEVPTWAFSS